MSNSNGSPGPWFIQQEQNPTTPSSGRSETLAIHDAHGERVALSNNLADARLLAAAPILLEALEAVAPNKWGVSAPVRAKIEAALKQARGEQ